MKNTGVMRKIDNLGRLVIPKELRNGLNIQNNDDVEIYVDNDLIILKKYSYVANNNEKYNKLIDCVNDIVEGEIIITDKERIISHNNLEGTLIPKEILSILDKRKFFVTSEITRYLFGNVEKYGYFIIAPIIINSCIEGSIILFKKSEFIPDDIAFMKIIKKIFEKNQSIC